MVPVTLRKRLSADGTTTLTGEVQPRITYVPLLGTTTCGAH
jgi:hypothetical protein